jgi:hypothetical protein
MPILARGAAHEKGVARIVEDRHTDFQRATGNEHAFRRVGELESLE